MIVEGDSGEITVVLSSAPTSNVTVNIVRSDGTEIRLSKTELTFTPSNWNIIQTVTLTAEDDEDITDDEETLIFIARGDDYEENAISVHPEAVTIDSLGQSVQLSAIIQDQDGSPVTGVSFNWSSADSSVAVVDSTGKVTAVGLGMTAITATLDAIPETATISGEATVQVASDGITDRDVLVALYHATDGPNWVDNTNWLTDAPLGEWYGVETDNAGRVVGLRLRGRWDNEVRRYIPHLSGSIPPELGDLASLSSLDLSRNDLSGPIPPELGNLVNLRELGLS
ncbi:MAG: Ig-like domain-containing protein, partial [Bacteroidetes bacterium]|nr:Ig-like domain-containing protein [Bacteroidota bacterium]